KLVPPRGILRRCQATSHTSHRSRPVSTGSRARSAASRRWWTRTGTASTYLRRWVQLRRPWTQSPWSCCRITPNTVWLRRSRLATAPRRFANSTRRLNVLSRGAREWRPKPRGWPKRSGQVGHEPGRLRSRRGWTGADRPTGLVLLRPKEGALGDAGRERSGSHSDREGWLLTRPGTGTPRRSTADRLRPP